MTLNKLVIGFIGFVFLLILSVYILVGFFGVILVKEIDEKGAKQVIERVWEGEVIGKEGMPMGNE
jgi:hypothetical protein